MTSCFSCWSKFFRAFDLFPNSKLLRYNGQADYTSTSGGIISMAVIIIFIVLFASMGIRTVQRNIIFASIENINNIEPPALQVTLGPEGQFMFAVYVYGFNMSSLPRLFDVKIEQQFFHNGYRFLNSTTILMETCTQEHFNFNSDLGTLGQRIPLSQGLCPQIGQKITVLGKITSNLYSHISLNVTRCNSTIDPFCVNDTVFAGIEAVAGKFVVALLYVNTNVNPGSEVYRDYYLEDENTFYFNSQLGTLAFAYLQEDIINTDVSIMPYEQIQDENVTRIANSFTTSQFLTSGGGGNLVELYLRKSPTTAIYERSFNKIDAYFSYVGGLVGTILGLIFIMEFYTEKAYQISLARKVMTDNEKNEIPSKSFNIAYYFSMVIKKLLNFIKIQPNWSSTNLYSDCCEQIAMQIDIAYMVRKLMFLDAAIQKLLDQHELQAIYLRQKPTIEKAKELRKKHFALQRFKNNLKGSDDNDDSQGSGGRKGIFNTANNGSKQELIFQDLEGSNSKMHQFRQKQPSQSQDISAIQFSENEEDLDQIREAVVRVEQKKKSGKGMSGKIINDIDPQILDEILTNKFRKKKQKKEENPDGLNILKIKPVSGKEQIENFSDKSDKKKQEDFEYNFDQ